MSTDEEHWHGTMNGYTNRKCRCDACREAWRIGHAEYMARNEWQRRLHASREIARYHAGRASHSRPRKPS